MLDASIGCSIFTWVDFTISIMVIERSVHTACIFIVFPDRAGRGVECVYKVLYRSYSTSPTLGKITRDCYGNALRPSRKPYTRILQYICITYGTR